MGFMDESHEREVAKNKSIRGYIIRALGNGHNHTLLIRQIANALVGEGLIFSPDISKYLEYLKDSGYITFPVRKANAYQAYRRDCAVKLTKKGIDLAECTIEDPGVEI